MEPKFGQISSLKEQYFLILSSLKLLIFFITERSD